MPLNPRNLKFNIRQARFPADVELVRGMFRDYQADIQVDLCFQSFEEEVATLPGKYVCVLVCEGGCVAMRPMTDGAIELKRLFVYPSHRGTGLGRELARTAIGWAIENGYRVMRLDTIQEKMPSAVALYRTLGFREVPGAVEGCGPELLFMELDLLQFAAQGDAGH